MAQPKVSKIGFIGAGQMAKALAGGIAGSQPGHYQVLFFDPSEPTSQLFRNALSGTAEVIAAPSNQDVVTQSEVVFIAVKPHLVEKAIASVSFETNPLVISVAAGVEFDSLSRWTGIARIIRAMPNTPCLIGQGAIGFAAGTGINEDDLALAQALLQSVGIALPVAPHLLDAVTGVSGSGPAYVYTFVEAMIDGGVLTGLPRPVARELALQTVLGAASMIQQLGEHPGVLRDQVTSPGGTTIEGLKALEDQGFRSAVMSAILAAKTRSEELGK
ncbi:MAG: pyrroline-5-carboxylate reductase [Planctomycetota bacterium]